MAGGKRVEIVDRESFEAWIVSEKPPVEWLRALSCRMALRVMPLAMVITPDSLKSNDIRLLHNLMARMFRANIISRVASTCPTRDMNANAANAANAAFVANSAFAATNTINATNAAIAANSTAAANVAFATANAADAANNANNISFAANAAANAADAANATAAFWRSLETDCLWFVDNRAEYLETDELSIDQALQAGLMAQALWVDKVPEDIADQLDTFAQSELAQETSFGLIVDWYRGVSGKGVSPFEEDRDLALAQQGETFWEGEPLDVMDRVAVFVGWEREKSPQPDSKSTRSSNSSPQPSVEVIKQRLEMNEKAIVASGMGLEFSIAEYHEKVRGNNGLDDDFKKGLLEFLDGISGDIKTLVELAQNVKGEEIDDDQAQEAASWLTQFNAHFRENLPRYFTPEHAAEISPPIAIIFGCGGLGAMLGGPIGFGAGAYVGKLISKEAKPGTASNKVEKLFGGED